MKKQLFFIVLVTGMICSCGGEEVRLGYEPGIYQAYKQDVSPIYAMTFNKTIDGNLIKWKDFYSGKKKVGDIHFEVMPSSDPFETHDPLRDPVIHIDSIRFGKNNEAEIYYIFGVIMILTGICSKDGFRSRSQKHIIIGFS